MPNRFCVYMHSCIHSKKITYSPCVSVVPLCACYKLFQVHACRSEYPARVLVPMTHTSLCMYVCVCVGESPGRTITSASDQPGFQQNRTRNPQSQHGFLPEGGILLYCSSFHILSITHLHYLKPLIVLTAPIKTSAKLLGAV